MSNLGVFYEQTDGTMFPVWLIVAAGILDWDKPCVYIPVEAPFRHFLWEEYPDQAIGFSVLLADLVVHPGQPGRFGLDLARVQERLRARRLKPSAIEHLIVRIADLEEVLQMNLRSRYGWRSRETDLPINIAAPNTDI